MPATSARPQRRASAAPRTSPVGPGTWPPGTWWLALACLVLLQPPGRCGSGSGFGHDFYGNETAPPSPSPSLRFRDFEPRSRGDPTEREGRGLQIHADKDDLKVDIEFIVPFVRIPVKRSMELTKTTFRNLVDLNTGSLLWSGMFVAVGVGTAALVKAFSPTTLFSGYGYGYGYKAAGRGVTEPEEASPGPLSFVTQRRTANGGKTRRMATSVNDLVSSVESRFREHDIDLRACVQKSICEFVREAAVDVGAGRATGLAKIVDGLASLESLHEYLSGTALHKAVDSGKGAADCAQVFAACRWRKPADVMIAQLTKYLRSWSSG